MWTMYPPNPMPAMQRAFAEDIRKWSQTTDLMVAPPSTAFDLALWTTDIIVRPIPGELIVWVPPNRNMFMPPKKRIPFPSTQPKARDESMFANFIHTVFNETRHRTKFASRSTVIGFYTLVIGYLVIASLFGLELLEDAWRRCAYGYTFCRLEVLAALDFVEQKACNLYRSMVRCAALIHFS